MSGPVSALISADKPSETEWPTGEPAKQLYTAALVFLACLNWLVWLVTFGPSSGWPTVIQDTINVLLVFFTQLAEKKNERSITSPRDGVGSHLLAVGFFFQRWNTRRYFIINGAVMKAGQLRRGGRPRAVRSVPCTWMKMHFGLNCVRHWTHIWPVSGHIDSDVFISPGSSSGNKRQSACLCVYSIESDHYALNTLFDNSPRQ